jgi:hypothetical protein
MAFSFTDSIISTAPGEPKPFNIFFSYDGSLTSSNFKAVHAVQRALKYKGYGIFEHNVSHSINYKEGTISLGHNDINININ